MTPDEARAAARAVANAWPQGRWTPGALEQWATDLQRFSIPAFEETMRRLRVRLIDPPVWAEFATELRHHEPVHEARPDRGLDLDGHKQAIAALRAQHKFLNK